MASKTWTLADLEQRKYEDQIILGPNELGVDAQVSKRTLRGGRSDGVDVVSVQQGKFRFDVLPTRGMSLWKAWQGDTEIGWQSPVRGPVHPNFVPLMEPSGLGWLDGFDELMVRCGLESNGAPDFDEKTNNLTYPLHGKIGNLPAHKVEIEVDTDKNEVSVIGVVEESRFHFTKLRMTSRITTKIGESAIYVRDDVQNLSQSSADMQMLYHVNFGFPMLDAGSRFFAPAKTVVPRNERAASGIGSWNNYAAEEPGFEEQVYFLELLADEKDRTLTLLANTHGTRGLVTRFNKKQLPCYTVWKNTTAREDGYVTGLEPGTNFPNPRSYEKSQKRVLPIGPGKTVSFDLTLEFLDNGSAIERAEKEVSRLQAATPAKVYDKPQKGWCAP